MFYFFHSNLCKPWLRGRYSRGELHALFPAFTIAQLVLDVCRTSSEAV